MCFICPKDTQFGFAHQELLQLEGSCWLDERWIEILIGVAQYCRCMKIQYTEWTLWKWLFGRWYVFPLKAIDFDAHALAFASIEQSIAKLSLHAAKGRRRKFLPLFLRCEVTSVRPILSHPSSSSVQCAVLAAAVFRRPTSFQFSCRGSHNYILQHTVTTSSNSITSDMWASAMQVVNCTDEPVQVKVFEPVSHAAVHTSVHLVAELRFPCEAQQGCSIWCSCFLDLKEDRSDIQCRPETE